MGAAIYRAGFVGVAVLLMCFSGRRLLVAAGEVTGSLGPVLLIGVLGVYLSM